jgi:hypothetical protein
MTITKTNALTRTRTLCNAGGIDQTQPAAAHADGTGDFAACRPPIPDAYAIRVSDFGQAVLTRTRILIRTRTLLPYYPITRTLNRTLFPTLRYMVLEFMAGGELFFWLKKDRRFSITRTRLYTAEILLGLKL